MLFGTTNSHSFWWLATTTVFAVVYAVSHRKAGLKQFGKIKFSLLSTLVHAKRLEKIAISSRDHYDLTDPSIGNINHMIPVQMGKLFYRIELH